MMYYLDPLRLAAIKWDLSLPQFFPKGTSDADR